MPTITENRRWYRSADWDGYRQAFQGEQADGYVVCRYGFGWCGEWLGPGLIRTYAAADLEREHQRRILPAGNATVAVVAVKAT